MQCTRTYNKERGLHFPSLLFPPGLGLRRAYRRRRKRTQRRDAIGVRDPEGGEKRMTLRGLGGGHGARSEGFGGPWCVEHALLSASE